MNKLKILHEQVTDKDIVTKLEDAAKILKNIAEKSNNKKQSQSAFTAFSAISDVIQEIKK